MRSFWLHRGRTSSLWLGTTHGEITKIVQKAIANSNDESACESDESASVQLSNSDSDKEDTVVFCSEYVRYQDGPLAKSSDGSSDGHEQNIETDLDGLTPNTLVARKDGTISVSSW